LTEAGSPSAVYGRYLRIGIELTVVGPRARAGDPVLESEPSERRC